MAMKIDAAPFGTTKSGDAVTLYRIETPELIVSVLDYGATVQSVIHMRTQHLGPEELLVAAKIAVRHDDTAAAVAQAIDQAEERVRAAVPIARVIYLEPDIRRRTAADGSGATASRG